MERDQNNSIQYLHLFIVNISFWSLIVRNQIRRCNCHPLRSDLASESYQSQSEVPHNLRKQHQRPWTTTRYSLIRINQQCWTRAYHLSVLSTNSSSMDIGASLGTKTKRSSRLVSLMVCSVAFQDSLYNKTKLKLL